MMWVGFIWLKVGIIMGLSERCNTPLNPMNGRKFFEEYLKFSRALLIGVHLFLAHRALFTKWIKGCQYEKLNCPVLSEECS